VIHLYNQWRFTTGLQPTLLIEDTGSGSALIQDLSQTPVRASAVRPVGEKSERMSAQSATIENGQVVLPLRAPWLENFRAEILAFPNGEHDDQVDCTT
jgi:predicted phage terminase large subunit-like protein